MRVTHSVEGLVDVLAAEFHYLIKPVSHLVEKADGVC